MAEQDLKDSMREGKKFQFLHIPKTGGSSIKHALRTYVDGIVELHRHKTRLPDIERGHPIGFVVRDPVSRFISAFYSRKRKGQPRYNSEWNPIECQVFEAFETPRDLAEALGDAGNLNHSLALQAMEGIGHLRKLSFWLGNTQALEARKDDIRFVGFQESLTDDFERFKRLVGLPSSIKLPSDDVSAHRNPTRVDDTLSHAAVDAIKAWYKEDYELIELLKSFFKPDLINDSNLEVGMQRQDSSKKPASAEKDLIQTHSARENKNIITVLGSGRSGTSLLMQILQELGMSTIGSTMIAASGSNPEGFFEDQEIVNVHRKLFGELAATHVSALPTNWLDTEPAHEACKKLESIIRSRLHQAGNNIWGFKDPRTNNFMPLWVRLFNKPGILPRYIIAIRNPSSVVASLREQGSRNDLRGEFLWLRRNIEALHNTAGNCFIVHYEDWFERPEELVRGLLAYTGLHETFKGDIDEVVNRVVKAQLNRAPRQHQDIKVTNPCVTELYEVLRECRGEDFDHDTLMDSVERARRIMRSFDAGVVLPQTTVRSNKTGQNAVNKNLDEITEKSEKECKALQGENSRLLRELTVTTKDVENLRAQLVAQQKIRVKADDTDKTNAMSQKISKLENKLRTVRKLSATRVMKRDQKITRLQKRVKATRQSYSFKIGWTIVSAIKKPGMNTIKAPFRLLKLSFMFFGGRR